jgi:hypothetical protein
VVAGAITRVADAHSHTCDREDPESPASSVTIVREGDQGLDYLVLFDSVIVLDGPSDVKVMTDRRVDAGRVPLMVEKGGRGSGWAC